jgi:sugar transferase (PEP-CTERM/EpsH1 system associated)
VKLVALRPLIGRVRSLGGLVTGEALSLAYYRSRELRSWVDATIDSKGITHAVVFSSSMAQYLQRARHTGLCRVADFCDVDSDKWRQYAQARSGPARWFFTREADRLLVAERAIAQEFDATLFVTRAEADLFRALAPESVQRVGHFDNGVDTDYFDPGARFESPYGEALDDRGTKQRPVIVFTGAMDYWANVDAVEWFVAEVWPRIRARAPQARFYIVGSKPTRAVQMLARNDGVQVTGRVPDVRPYLAHADVAVAPLRIARGTQNKVLEALAMARPVVCTSHAASGLELSADAGLRTHDDAAEFADAVLAMAEKDANLPGRARVTESFGWRANLSEVDRLLEAAGAA